MAYADVKHEVETHEQDMQDFIADRGDHAVYGENEVFEWLGY